MKILVTRTDRLGDLVLALPVADLLAELHPDWTVEFLVAPGLEAVAKAQEHVAGVRAWRDDWPADRQQALADELRAAGFDAALMLQYRRELALVLRRAGIPRVFGPYSRLTSWFLLHGGLRQGRSRSGRHEMDLNLELACALAGMKGARRKQALAAARRPRLKLDAEQAAWGRKWRETEAAGARKVALIHPGSGGSALDWEAVRFAEVANLLARKPGVRAFITGGAADARMVRQVASGLDAGVGVLLERFTLSRFMAVLAAGDVLVAPSTGPLHLAAALGTPTVGLFPPAPVMHAARWGQRGRDAVHLEPEVDCPARRRCRRERCAQYNCLDRVDPREVAARAAALLDARPERDNRE